MWEGDDIVEGVDRGPAAPDVAPTSPGAVTRARFGAASLVLIGAISVQFGAAVAALLFPRAGALGVVTLRLVVAALILLAVCRPRLRGHSATAWRVVVAFGIVLGVMNVLFYQAIARIPLGAAVTLEFLGPLTLSIIVSRRLVMLLWAALALAGVLLLSNGGLQRLNLAGTTFALAAGAAWAAYIILSARTGQHFPRADGLAIAMAIGATAVLPFGLASAGRALLDPVTLGLATIVAVLSSVIPYTLELVALRRLPAATFAVLTSLDPALAGLAGYLVLNQSLTVAQGLAIGLVTVASMGAVLTRPRASSVSLATP